ncbi:hypothetical protein EMWEY_00030060 [Eimeria maxima]|uniref:Uncharacterized protein n=1 Tax=Eimeria maxima TaxID=5804 RepID=U6M833_EIMMA|nr:hypothetical protein EMWEY_00030060 [Eimeria maxima]CDJ60377.1 hypothetical protein EMWEY_00030060 [Eimeria maxima]
MPSKGKVELSKRRGGPALKAKENAAAKSSRSKVSDKVRSARVIKRLALGPLRAPRFSHGVLEVEASMDPLGAPQGAHGALE